MVKQVIVMRKDLKMRRGKEIAQGAHAAIKFLVERPKQRTVAEEHWFNECDQKTVCLYVNSEQELEDLYKRCCKSNVQVYIQTDTGKTEFNGVSTNTCIAIGPEYEELVDKITGSLKLY